MIAPPPYGWRLAVFLARGENERADELLDAINQVQRAFGYPDYEMPPPASTGLPDLVWCPALPYDRMSIDLDDDGGRVAA